MKNKIILSLFLLSIKLFVHAYPNMIVEHYTVEDGLPNNTIYCSLKGQDGFMWFGTWYGLCSFDGMKFRSYGDRNGFSSTDIPPRKIQRIVEDKNGFLWIKTVDRKLYLFDKKYESFHAVYNDMKGYSENIQIIRVELTEEGDVLLLTMDKSLLRAATDKHGKISIRRMYDSRPDVNFHDMHLRHNVFSETAEFINWVGVDNQIFSLKKGESMKNKPADFIKQKVFAESNRFTCSAYCAGLFWLGTQDGIIYSIDLEMCVVNRYEMPDIKKPIYNLFVTNSGVMYIISGKDIYEYNIGYKRLTKLPFIVEEQNKGGIFIDKYDKVWIREDNHSLIYYDPLNKIHRQFMFPGNNYINSFSWQDAGEKGIYFLVPGGEIWLFDREKLEMISVNQLKSFSDSTSDLLFFDLLLDRDGLLWFASTENGVYRVNFPKKQFSLLEGISPVLFDKKENLWNKGIRAIYQAKNGDIWVGTRWKGLYCLNSYGKVKHLFSEKDFLVGAVYHIMEDKDGNLWFSTKGNGLVKAEPDLNSPHGIRFVRYKNIPNDPNSISSNDVYCTFQDSKGRIWVALLGGGLNLVVNENGKTSFKHKYNSFKQYPSYGLYMEVRTIVEDNFGRIWVGTMDGLMSFDNNFKDPENIHFEIYRKRTALNVADNDIYVLYKDTESNIWASVFGGGLNKLLYYDKEKHEPVFKSYGIREGMDNEVVKAIVEDKNGNLWFSTERGLSSFNKTTQQFRNYDKYDGFLELDLEESSAFCTLNGDLWIGSKQGILTFSPDKLEVQHTNYDTRIVDFKISNSDFRNFGEKMAKKKSIIYAESIELQHDQSMFTIEFAALNFYNQNRVSYRYILDGYEKEWHYNGKNRIASYTNVPPGIYKFRVETIDESNSQLNSTRTLVITILPPWWSSWWATVIYIILSIIFIYFVLRLVFFMIRMKNEVYIEQRVSEMKIKFFTNISHELRTPLTLIKGPILELKDRENLSPKGMQYVELMEKNTNQMLQLVNQILDFRKIQNGKMRLHVSLIDFNEMLVGFKKEFNIFSEENEISFTFQLPDEHIMLWADKEKISIVIRNIISNAFKFTPSGGKINIISGLTEDEKCCFLRIEDTGIGIPQNKLSEIFERFSQGTNTKNSYYQGTGIGLALSKEIVNLHHGSVRAESIEGKGSAFIVELLLGKEHYSLNEVDFYVSDTESISDEAEEEGGALGNTDELSEIDSSLPILLLVEDNKDLCKLIKLQLEDKFNIYIANNGSEGLKKTHLYHPDIVVTDQMMPKMDGLEMLQLIRTDFQISHIPVIILTAKNDEGAKTKAISLGANAYITKPFSKEYLLARIEQLLSERKLFRERVRLQMDGQKTVVEDSYEQYLVKKDVHFLDKIYQVIETNMDDSDFNIDTIASEIGLSRSAFFKKLKSLTGLAPVDFVKEIRLNKSVELIKNTDLSVSEIAFSVGFKDSSYYSKCFRKKYNQTPREYMSEVRKAEK